MKVTRMVVEINNRDDYEESLKASRYLACLYSCEINPTYHQLISEKLKQHVV